MSVNCHIQKQLFTGFLWKKLSWKILQYLSVLESLFNKVKGLFETYFEKRPQHKCFLAISRLDLQIYRLPSVFFHTVKKLRKIWRKADEIKLHILFICCLYCVLFTIIYLLARQFYFYLVVVSLVYFSYIEIYIQFVDFI